MLRQWRGSAVRAICTEMGPWSGSARAPGWRLEVRLGYEGNTPPGVMEEAPVSRPILWVWRKSCDTFTTGPKAWESASACSWDREGECWERCGKLPGWNSSCWGVDVEEEEAGLWMAATGERWEGCCWDWRDAGRLTGVDLVLLASLTSLSWALWRGEAEEQCRTCYTNKHIQSSTAIERNETNWYRERASVCVSLCVLGVDAVNYYAICISLLYWVHT